MGRGTSQKQRRFAEGIADGRSLQEAAEEAGYQNAKQRGQELVANPRVLRLIAEQQAQLARDVGITRAQLAGNLASIAFDPAFHPGPRITATEALARLMGYVGRDNTTIVLSQEERTLRLAAVIAQNPAVANQPGNTESPGARTDAQSPAAASDA